MAQVRRVDSNVNRGLKASRRDLLDGTGHLTGTNWRFPVVPQWLFFTDPLVHATGRAGCLVVMLVIRLLVKSEVPAAWRMQVAKVLLVYL